MGLTIRDLRVNGPDPSGLPQSRRRQSKGIQARLLSNPSNSMGLKFGFSYITQGPHVSIAFCGSIG